MYVKLSKELFEALMNYLASKPYAEVHQVMAELLKLRLEEGEKSE